MNKKELQYLLKKHNLQPRREQGQNFLVNQGVVNTIINAAKLKKDDIVLEIGPGLGAITVELCKKAEKVVAVEQDREFMPILKQLTTVNSNLEVINSDVFKLKLAEKFKNREYKLVSNLPFNITSLVLRNFLEYLPKPSKIVVLIQKEVAERVVAEPGKMSALSVATQLFGNPKIIEIIEKISFYPEPEVDCAILSIDVYSEEQLALKKLQIKPFFELIHHGYAARRKKLTNNLANGYQISKPEVEEKLKQVHLNVNCRPQDLSVKQWLALFDAFFQM